MEFKVCVGQKFVDKCLQQNFIKFLIKFVIVWVVVIQDIDFQVMCEVLKECCNCVLENFDVWFVMFEVEVICCGVKVLFVEIMVDVVCLVVEIVCKYGVKKVIKSKLMVIEEMCLNQVFGEMGVQSIEIDLGEYILQINDSELLLYIIVLVVYKDKEEIVDFFVKMYNKLCLIDIFEMMCEVCEVLWFEFLFVDMGVMGGNFIIVEMGFVVVVINEGNEGMCMIMLCVYVVVMGIEKVLLMFEDLVIVMCLLL